MGKYEIQYVTMNQERILFDKYVNDNNIPTNAKLYEYLFDTTNKKRYNYYHQLFKLANKHYEFTQYAQNYLIRHDIRTMADALILLFLDDNVTHVNYTLANTLVWNQLPMKYKDNNYRNGLMAFCNRFTCPMPSHLNDHNGLLEYMCYAIKDGILDKDIGNNNVVNILCKKICISKLFADSNADMLSRVLSAALRTISSEEFGSLINNVNDEGCTPVHNCLDSMNLECFRVLCKYESTFDAVTTNFIANNNDMMFMFKKLVGGDLEIIENGMKELTMTVNLAS
jgi:hypothetical protein